MSVGTRDRRFGDVVGVNPACERLSDGFLFIEGPLWDPRRNRLLFSDIPGNALMQWSPATGVRVFRTPSNMTNGLP